MSTPEYCLPCVVVRAGRVPDPGSPILMAQTSYLHTQNHLLRARTLCPTSSVSSGDASQRCGFQKREESKSKSKRLPSFRPLIIGKPKSSYITCTTSMMFLTHVRFRVLPLTFAERFVFLGNRHLIFHIRFYSIISVR